MPIQKEILFFLGTVGRVYNQLRNLFKLESFVSTAPTFQHKIFIAWLKKGTY